MSHLDPIHPRALLIASVLLSAYEDFLRVRRNSSAPSIDSAEQFSYNPFENKRSNEIFNLGELNAREEQRDE